jgi:hypothetical protein
VPARPAVPPSCAYPPNSSPPAAVVCAAAQALVLNLDDPAAERLRNELGDTVGQGEGGGRAGGRAWREAAGAVAVRPPVSATWLARQPRICPRTALPLCNAAAACVAQVPIVTYAQADSRADVFLDTVTYSTFDAEVWP